MDFWGPPVLQNATYLQCLKTNGTIGLAIGINASDRVAIDPSGIGTVLPGAGLVSTPMLTLTGAFFTGGSATTTKPQLLIEPAGATSTAWNTNGTGLGVNAASGFTGMLIDAQTNAITRFQAAASGTDVALLNNNAGNCSLVLQASGVAARITGQGASLSFDRRFTSSVAGAVSAPNTLLTGAWFTGGTTTTTKPFFLIEPSGATSTAWSVNGTGLGINAAAGATGMLLDCQVAAVYRGQISASGTDVLNLNNSGGQCDASYSSSGVAARWGFDGANVTFATARAIRPGTFTVGTLPAAGNAGRRATVTDALAPVFGAAVAAGGAVTVPVYDTGAAWFVG